MNPIIILVAIICGAVFLFTLIVAPKWLALTLWPVIMVYPHSLTYGMLPMNIGFDDLYLSLVFVAITLRLGMPRFSFPLKAVIIFYAIMFISSMTGVLVTPVGIGQKVAKFLLKDLVFIMFTWTFLTSIREEKDIRLHIFSFIISMTAACAIAFADIYNVPFAQLFYAKVEEVVYVRAIGPFLGPDVVGYTTLLPMFICLVGLTAQRKTFQKTIFGIGAVIIGAALFASGSRLGWMAALFGLVFMFLMTRRRFILVIGGVLLLLIMARLVGSETWHQILHANITRTVGQSGYGADARIVCWLDYLRNPYFAMLFCGRGMLASEAAGLGTPHSGYLDALFLYGLVGTLFFGTVMYRVIKLSRWLSRNDYDPLLSVFAQGFFVGVVCWLVAAIPGDPLLSTHWLFGFFFTITILWSRQEMLQAMGFLVPYPSKDIYAYDLEEEYSYVQENLSYPV